MDEFQSLVQIVCNSASPLDNRQRAEQRLQEIQNDKDSWQILLNFLSCPDNNLLFFIGMTKEIILTQSHLFCMFRPRLIFMCLEKLGKFQS
jgi:hypothetical protein